MQKIVRAWKETELYGKRPYCLSVYQQLYAEKPPEKKRFSGGAGTAGAGGGLSHFQPGNFRSAGNTLPDQAAGKNSGNRYLYRIFGALDGRFFSRGRPDRHD